MTDLAAALQGQRTLTQADVDHRAFVHGLDIPAPQDVIEVRDRHAEHGAAER